MAIPFQDEFAALAADLERAGFGEARVLAFPYVPARRLELHLPGGLVVRWDRKDALLFVEGPPSARRQLERFLESREKHALARFWALLPTTAKGAVLAALLIAGSAYAAMEAEERPGVGEAERTPTKVVS